MKENNFEDHIRGEKPVLVDFFADWCAPCKLMQHVLVDLKASVGSTATVLKMDIEKNHFYAKKYNIQTIPTLIIFKNGSVIWRKSGVTTSNEIMHQLALHVV